MNNRYVLDSWALLALFYEEEPASSRIEALLQQAAEGQASLFLSIMNFGELFYIFGRRRGVEAAEAMVTHVKQLPLLILEADEARVLAAARHKMAHPIAYADAFALAAAVELEATLVTGDPELVGLEGQVELEQLERFPRR